MSTASPETTRKSSCSVSQWVGAGRLAGVDDADRHPEHREERLRLVLIVAGERQAEALPRFLGKEWWFGDAGLVICTSRSSGLTCTAPTSGLSFWLGRYKGYRIFYKKPGFLPSISKRFFRTAHGVYCGLAATLEPANPAITCWVPGSGLQLSIAHDNAGQRGTHTRNERAKGYRPKGFRALPASASFSWRCRSVSEDFAERCSTSAGQQVLSCTSTPARLTCRNGEMHGFWVSRGGFSTF
jgi:hypothetical protein